MAFVHANGADAPNHIVRFNPNDRRHFIGGSAARTITGDDQDSLVRLWREKRGEVEPENLSDNLIVQLGTVTEVLNRAWYQRSSKPSKTSRSAFATPFTNGWQQRWTASSSKPGPSSKPNSCCPGRRPRLTNTWPSCSATCGSQPPGAPCSQSSPAAANGLGSRSMLIRSISTSCSRLRRSFDAASKAASRLSCSTSKRRVPGWKRSRSSICPRPISGRS